MENTIRTQTNKMLDHDSLLLASLIVKDVNRLIRCIHAITAVLVRYATIAVHISNGLRHCIEPAAAMQNRSHIQRMERTLQAISIAELPLAG